MIARRFSTEDTVVKLSTKPDVQSESSPNYSEDSFDSDSSESVDTWGSEELAFPAPNTSDAYPMESDEVKARAMAQRIFQRVVTELREQPP